jgi:acetyltransferase-like isoleucine patch superfamily enzyme
MNSRFNHPAALVESDQIGPGTRVWAFAHVMAGAQIGSNCNICDHAFVESGASVGNNVTLKNHVCVWLGVRLEDDVFVGPNVSFTNDRQPRSPRMPQVRGRYERTENWLEPTVVEQGTSIGANATIVPGIRLGRYCMIAAGSVVTSDVPAYALMVGAPARHVADLCRCGQKLAGDYRSTVCQHCGETPLLRCHSSEMEAFAL